MNANQLHLRCKDQSLKTFAQQPHSLSRGYKRELPPFLGLERNSLSTNRFANTLRSLNLRPKELMPHAQSSQFRTLKLVYLRISHFNSKVNTSPFLPLPLLHFYLVQYISLRSRDKRGLCSPRSL